MMRLVSRDGAEIDVMLEGRIQRNAKGEFVRTHCVLIDISERLHVEAALRDSEHRLRELLNRILNRAWFKDTGCRYVYMIRYCRLIGSAGRCSTRLHFGKRVCSYGTDHSGSRDACNDAPRRINTARA